MTQMIKIYHCVMCGKILNFPADTESTFTHSEFPDKIFHKCKKFGGTYGLVTIAGLKEVKDEAHLL